MALGERIRALREERGWSVMELARRSEVYQNTISMIEAGKTQETRKLSAIARAFGVTIQDLVGDQSLGGSMDEGHLVDIHSIKDNIVAASLKAAMHNRRAEVWQLSTDLLDGANKYRGDYVVVDLGTNPYPGAIVQAVKHEGSKQKILFRAFYPPKLMLLTVLKADQWPPGVKVETVDDRSVIVRGVVIVSVR